MTIKTLLKQTNNIDRLDAELLLAHVLKKPREYLLIHEKESVSVFTSLHFSYLTKKRKRGIPLAYLTGHKEFFGLDFLVNKHTLIPRPDTEILVEEVIKQIKQPPLLLGEGRGEVLNRITLIDIGTGSGCIPISIQKTIQQYNNVTVPTYATDISKPALKVAQKNAAKHNTPITFLHGNLLTPFINTCQLANLPTCHLFITANLPYLTAEQFQSEPSIQHEPRSALVAENKGLALYEELLKQLQEWLSGDTCYVIRVMCYFEIDPDQSELIKPLITNYFPKATVTIKKDLSGFDRTASFTV